VGYEQGRAFLPNADGDACAAHQALAGGEGPAGLVSIQRASAAVVGMRLPPQSSPVIPIHAMGSVSLKGQTCPRDRALPKLVILSVRLHLARRTLHAIMVGGTTATGIAMRYGFPAVRAFPQ
jgi:hypothetical protein